MRFCLRRDLWKISWFILGISRKLQFSSFFALSYIFFIFFCNYICISLTNILHGLGEIVAYWGVATPCLLLYLQIIQIHLLQLSASVLFVVATVHHYPFWLLYSMFLMGLLMGVFHGKVNIEAKNICNWSHLHIYYTLCPSVISFDKKLSHQQINKPNQHISLQ